MSNNLNKTRMQPVDNMLVCLDLTAIDSFMISYAGFLAEKLDIRHVSFFHVIQAYDLPDRASRRFPDMETELTDIVSDELHQLVDSHFDEQCRWDVVTEVGYEDAAQEIVEYIKDNDVDLTVIGQKSGENREGRYGQKVASEAPSDILFVPQHVAQAISPVLCAIDFSDESTRAFELSLDIKRFAGAAPICYFVSDPSRAYFPASTVRSSQLHEAQCRKTCEEFLQAYALSLNDVACLIEDGDPMKSTVENIYEAAKDNQAGLIVVGAQGDTSTMTSLLGNLCESFRLIEKDIPVLIVKHIHRRKFSWLWKKLTPDKASATNQKDDQED